MSESTDPAHSATETHLRRIAELLERPLRDFFRTDGPRPDRVWIEEVELLRLWRDIRCGDDRARALATLRGLAGAPHAGAAQECQPEQGLRSRHAGGAGGCGAPFRDEPQAGLAAQDTGAADRAGQPKAR